MSKINGNEIRPNNIIEHNGGLWIVTKVSHVKPGKGGAFAQVEMRNIRNGSKLNERFRSADKVEKVRLEQKDQQFLPNLPKFLAYQKHKAVLCIIKMTQRYPPEVVFDCQTTVHALVLRYACQIDCHLTDADNGYSVQPGSGKGGQLGNL